MTSFSSDAIRGRVDALRDTNKTFTSKRSREGWQCLEPGKWRSPLEEGDIYYVAEKYAEREWDLSVYRAGNLIAGTICFSFTECRQLAKRDFWEGEEW